MTQLIINRRSEWSNRGRNIGLYLDQKKIGTIKNGETKVFQIEPGEYNLSAKIDWCRSQNYKVQLNENETRSVILTGFSKFKWTIPILILIQLIMIILSYYDIIDHIFITASSLLIIAYIFYPITFGRNHYLKLNSN